jgi:quercetin dioxygenase-like cupin family protein
MSGEGSPPLKLGLAETLGRIDPAVAPFLKLVDHAGLELEIFAPKGEDTQQPHPRDELYVIASGRSGFRCEDQRVEVRAGDVLFVPAWAPHRFEELSDDFSTWVIFFGPERPRP